MKKLFSLVLALSMALALTACSGSADTDSTTDDTTDVYKRQVEIQAAVTCTGVTGVEMEALTAVSVAALTIYDMCKAVQKDMRIENIRLLSKSGGKSGDYQIKE